MYNIVFLKTEFFFHMTNIYYICIFINICIHWMKMVCTYICILYIYNNIQHIMTFHNLSYLQFFIIFQLILFLILFYFIFILPNHLNILNTFFHILHINILLLFFHIIDIFNHQICHINHQYNHHNNNNHYHPWKIKLQFNNININKLFICVSYVKIFKNIFNFVF